jgi:hypothetical protein
MGDRADALHATRVRLDSRGEGRRTGSLDAAQTAPYADCHFYPRSFWKGTYV